MATASTSPEQFPESNIYLGPPPDAATGSVNTIRAFVTPPNVAPRVWITKHQLTPEELAEVNANGGHVYLTILGATHPPVGLSAFYDAEGWIKAAAAIVAPETERANPMNDPKPEPTAHEIKVKLSELKATGYRGGLSRKERDANDAEIARLEAALILAEEREAAGPYDLPAD